MAPVIKNKPMMTPEPGDIVTHEADGPYGENMGGISHIQSKNPDGSFNVNPLAQPYSDPMDGSTYNTTHSYPENKLSANEDFYNVFKQGTPEHQALLDQNSDAEHKWDEQQAEARYDGYGEDPQYDALQKDPEMRQAAINQAYPGDGNNIEAEFDPNFDDANDPPFKADFAKMLSNRMEGDQTMQKLANMPTAAGIGAALGEASDVALGPVGLAGGLAAGAIQDKSAQAKGESNAYQKQLQNTGQKLIQAIHAHPLTTDARNHMLSQVNQFNPVQKAKKQAIANKTASSKVK